MSLLNDKAIMKLVYTKYPRAETYPHTYMDGKHTCGRRIICCTSLRDIVRCEECGHELETRCSWDTIN